MAIGFGTGISFPGTSSGGGAGAHMTGIRFDKKVSGGNQYIISMSDGSNFTFVMAEGATLNLKGLKNGSVPVYDAQTGELIDSGVFAKDGDLTMAPNSLKFGTHELSSTGEGSAFHNLATDKVYSPLWQEVAPGSTVGHIRAYSSARDIVRNARTAKVLTNPEFLIPVKKDETVYSIYVNFEEAASAIEIEILQAGKLMTRAKWNGPFQAGEKRLDLKPSWDFRKDNTYTARITNPNGGDIKLRGDATTPYWKINRSTWKELIIADRTWVAAQLKPITDAAAALSQQVTNIQNDIKGKIFSMDEIVQNLKGLGYLKTGGSPSTDHGPTARISAYVFFSPSAVTPTSIPSSAQVHSGDEFAVTKDNDAPEYVYIFVPSSSRTKVTRVAEKGGIPAVWRKTTSTISSTQYEVLRSPSAFVERSPTFILYP